MCASAFMIGSIRAARSTSAPTCGASFAIMAADFKAHCSAMPSLHRCTVACLVWWSNFLNSEGGVVGAEATSNWRVCAMLRTYMVPKTWRALSTIPVIAAASLATASLMSAVHGWHNSGSGSNSCSGSGSNSSRGPSRYEWRRIQWRFQSLHRML